MRTRALELACEDGPEGRVSALLDGPAPKAAPAAVLLAHGAGADMDSAFLQAIARDLAAAGLLVLRFRYPYMERMAREGRRRPPDRAEALERTHRAALAELRRRAPGAPILLGGKSLGARMASRIAADGAESAGLFFLGYPLHPAGRPERLRSEHFPRLAAPTLFLQGTRDALCDLELLERERRALAGPSELVVIDGADHDFQVPKRSGRGPADVRAELVAAILAWRAQLPAG